MEHDPHTGFIIAAYALAFIVIASMVGVIVSDYLSLRQSLRRFDPRGSKRS